jgi:predicted protein tyrosine phosphatase
MKLLFVCSRNRLRSPTAEAVFSAYEGVEALSAGTNPDADNPVSSDLIEWADLVFAMESVHRRKLQKRFGPLLRTKRVVALGIPDIYKYMEPELVRILKEKVVPHLKGKIQHELRFREPESRVLAPRPEHPDP